MYVISYEMLEDSSFCRCDYVIAIKSGAFNLIDILSTVECVFTQSMHCQTIANFSIRSAPYESKASDKDNDSILI